MRPLNSAVRKTFCDAVGKQDLLAAARLQLVGTRGAEAVEEVQKRAGLPYEEIHEAAFLTAEEV